MSFSSKNNVEFSLLNHAKLSKLNGPALARLNQQQFIAIDSCFGWDLYKDLLQYRKTRSQELRQPTSSPSPNTMSTSMFPPNYSVGHMDQTDTISCTIPAYSPQGLDEYSSHARSPSNSPLMTCNQPSPSHSPEPSCSFLPESLTELNTATVPEQTQTKVPRASPSRRKRGRKLWEFLLDLLHDPESNPHLIRWENRNEGVFRLMEQDTIASKWGQRREKEQDTITSKGGQRREKDNLPYDYFARALRYHYKSGMLISVPEKKLVYKFGPKIMESIGQ